MVVVVGGVGDCCCQGFGRQFDRCLSSVIAVYFAVRLASVIIFTCLRRA